MTIAATPTKLANDKLDLCHKTISSNAFLLLVGDAIANGKPLSVVRMADGECHFFWDAKKGPLNSLSEPPDGHGIDWLKRYGCDGITRGEILHRLMSAARNCTYFAPSLSGILKSRYDLYDLLTTRPYYVDGFFPNEWNEDAKIELFKAAKHVLLIHRSVHLADSLQIRARAGLGVKITWLKLNHWKQTEEIIQKANATDANLVLFSAGPAGKYIGPAIANSGKPKVVLDIGNAIDHWSLHSLKHLTRADADKTPFAK